MSEINEVLIQEPMVVATDGNAVIFVSRRDAEAQPVDILAKAQMYRRDDGIFSPVLPLGSFGKFMPMIRMVDPPEPFTKPT